MTYSSRGDASAFLARTQASISAETWVSPRARRADVTTFGEYAATWLALRPLTPRTKVTYRGLLNRVLLPRFEGMGLAEITSQDVREWFAGLPKTPTQNAHAYALLRTILGTAVTDDMLNVNPCRIRSAGRVKRAKVIKVLDREQVEALAALVPQHYSAMVRLAAYGCLRFGEITELRRSDLDGGVLHVRRGVTWVDGQPEVGRPKTVAGIRDIPLPRFLGPVLAAHLLEYAEPGKDGLIFPAREGGHMIHASLYKVFRRARRDLGRPDLRWHDLRHTGAVLWAQQGATLKDLMTLLGHETPAMAMHYQHLAEGSLERLADKFSDAWEASR